MVFLFGLIIGFFGTFSVMSAFYDYSKNPQIEKSSDHTETDNIVIPAFFVIGVGILIGFTFDGGFGLGFFIGGVIGLKVWNSIGEEGQKVFAEFFCQEKKKKDGKQRNKRFNQTRRYEASEVPPMTDFLRPILQWAVGRSRAFHRSEVLEAMANHFNLSFTARRERTEEGNMLRYEDRGSWALSHLKKAKLVRSISQGYYEITEAGKKEAFASNERMTTSYLTNNFLSYRHWKENRKNNKE